MIETPDELFDWLPSTFEDVSKKQVFVLIVQGKRVKVRSGKSMWSSKGAAKNALNHHLSCVPYSFRKRDSWDAMLKDWIEQNVQVMTEEEWLKSQGGTSSKSSQQQEPQVLVSTQLGSCSRQMVA